MNFRLTMILAVVLLACSVGYLWVSSRPPAVKSTATTSSLYTSKPGDITSISFVRYGSEDLKFEKQGDQWKLMPEDVNADNSQIDSLATMLQTLSYREKFDPEPTGNHSEEATGTDKPHYVVKFKDAGGKEFTVAFGKHSTDGIFATLNGGKTIFALDSNPVDRLDQRPDKFRNSQIEQLDSTKIARIVMKSRDQAWTLEKSGEKWLVSAPVSARANGNTAEEIGKELSNVRATTFSNLSKKDAGLDPPLISVSAYLTPPAPATTSPASAPATGPAQKPAVVLEIGYPTDLSLDKKSSPVYASVAGSKEVFVLSNDSLQKLNRSLKDVRDPAVTAAPVNNATQVTVSVDGKPTVSLMKKDAKWMLLDVGPSSTTVDADPSEVPGYLSAIGALRAINYLDNAGDLKSIGLDPPHMKIDMTLPGQSQHEVLLVGNPETKEGADKVTPVMRQGEASVYLLQTSEAEKLATSNVKLRDKQIEDLDTDKIRSIVINGPSATGGVATQPAATQAAAGGGPVMAAGKGGVTLQREGTHWVVLGNGGTGSSVPADDAKISSLLADFSPVETTKYLDDKAVSSGTPAVTVTVTMLEPTLNVPATAPAASAAAGPTTAAAAGPATAPATAPATQAKLNLPAAEIIAPDPGKLVTRTLRLYPADKLAAAVTGATGATGAPTTAANWKAVWESQTPAWTFEPTVTLIDHLTKETYSKAPAATAPATKP